jgi:hypothetical protein
MGQGSAKWGADQPESRRPEAWGRITMRLATSGDSRLARLARLAR